LYAHKPIVIGVLWLDEIYSFKRIGVIGEERDEAGMLQDFARFADDYRPHLVTYNGRSFDLPVIALRCLRHGVPMRFFFQDRDYRYRFSDSGHIDLYDFLSEHGAARVGSLDAIARVMGLPGKEIGRASWRGGGGVGGEVGAGGEEGGRVGGREQGGSES